MYKKSDKNNDVQKEFVKNTIQYFFVVVFFDSSLLGIINKI